MVPVVMALAVSACTRSAPGRPSLPGGSSLAVWVPTPGQSWQWILAGPLTGTDAALGVAVFDIDGFDNPASTVSSLHAQAKHAVCYINVGAWESWRSDANAFPASVLGSSNGWRGEKWLDIRQRGILEPLLRARFQMCKAKGFDAVEPDNLDGYANSTGFSLTASDQLAFNRWIADTVHSLGMSVALKNDPDQAADLEPSFDFAIDEQCYQYGECGSLSPFTQAGKAVFEVEYTGSTATFCPVTSGQYHFSSMKKNLSLDAYREPCP